MTNGVWRLNQLLKQKFQQHENDYFVNSGHFIPQYDYVYNQNGTRMVQHVLKFEQLQSDFDALMTLYNLSAQMTKRGATGSRPRSESATLTIDDLSPEIRKLIEVKYAKDFQAFDYPYYMPPTHRPPNTNNTVLSKKQNETHLGHSHDEQ